MSPPPNRPMRPGPVPAPLRSQLPRPGGASRGTSAPVVRQIRRRRPSLLRQLGVGFSVIFAFVAALPTALLLCFAMLPSMCAFLVDPHPRRYATRCVAALNFAGSWPYLILLWQGGHTVLLATQTLLNPRAWLVIYGAAAIGWICYMSFPPVIWAWMDVFAGRRIAYLRKQQKALVEDWGDDVAKAPLQPRL